MVKTTCHATPRIPHGSAQLLCAVLLAFPLLAACTAGGLVDLHPETLPFAPEAAGGVVSLVRTGGNGLLGVFSDRSTATLDSIQVAIGEHLPAQAKVSVVDVVDFAPPLSSGFGRHVLSASGEGAALLYEDRASADTTVLKLATRTGGEGPWTLDVMDPPGDPLSIVPSPAGGFDVFWAAGPLFWRAPGGTTVYVIPGFKASGTPYAFGSDGFTAFNAADGSLYVVERTGGIFRARPFPGAGPVQSSLVSPDGSLSILSWDGSTRRLLLMKDLRDGGQPQTTTVTLCDGTRTVALLPGPTGRPDLFLFDESSTTGGARTHRVSLVAPASVFGLPGNRYRKSVLFQGAKEIDSFAAVAAPGALYVLVQSGGMSLVRVSLPGVPASLS